VPTVDLLEVRHSWLPVPGAPPQPIVPASDQPSWEPFNVETLPLLANRVWTSQERLTRRLTSATIVSVLANSSIDCSAHPSIHIPGPGSRTQKIAMNWLSYLFSPTHPCV
jgi:hypothetical protein